MLKGGNEYMKKDNEILFKTLAEGWLNQVKIISKHSTYIKYRLIYQKYLEAKFSDYPVNKLTEDFLQLEILKMSDISHMSNSLCRSIYCVLNQIMSYGKRYYHTQAIKLTFKKQHTQARPIDILNRTEQARLIRVLYDDINRDKLGIIICMSTGLRLGEICALRWEDIDIRERVLHVNRTVQRIEVDGGITRTILLEGEPKSAFSKREIPISDALSALLLSFYGSGRYVLRDNRPMEPRTYQNHFRRYLEESEVERKNFHILRHTFATNCIDNGEDIKSLSEILGHSNVNITLNRYVHPTLETKRQHMNSLFSIYTKYIDKEETIF